MTRELNKMADFRLFVCVVCFCNVCVHQVVCVASVTDTLSSGVCLCVNEPNVAALTDRK